MLGLDYLSKHVVYSEIVLGSESARRLVENALRYLASPGDNATLASLYMLPRAIRYQPCFDDDELPANVSVARSGACMLRTAAGSWAGSNSTSFLDKRQAWRIRITAVGAERETAEYFVGTAKNDVQLDTTEDTNTVVLALKGAHVGDEITFVADFYAGYLHYWAELVDGRTELEWLDGTAGTLEVHCEADEDQDEEWVAFVQIANAGTAGHSASVDFVEIPAPIVPEGVEW
jgi:hypothetical protein